tara:strand:+ start:35 stop:547 length:513 start_codon:yes stop_codon:yes gene_type:complete
VKTPFYFRSWFYFRQGWSVYFAFIFAAINTLVVTYFLAIENYPILKEIFPTFETYLIMVVTIGIPLLITVGYLHYKRTPAFRAEASVMVESNPFTSRLLVNSDLTLKLNTKLMELILKISQGEKLSKEDILAASKIKDELEKLSNERESEKFGDNDIDLKYLKKMQQSNK